MKSVYRALFFIVVLLQVQSQTTWPQIAKAVATRTVHQYGRTIEKEEIYQQFRRSLKQQNLTLPQHVKKNIFGYTGEAKLPIFYITTAMQNDIPIQVYLQIEPQQKINWLIDHKLQNPLKGLNSSQHFALITINDFPYNFQPSIYHWVVWSNSELQFQTVSSVIDGLKSRQYDHLVYVNEPSYKSIPQIYHAQLFFHRRMDEL